MTEFEPKEYDDRLARVGTNDGHFYRVVHSSPDGIVLMDSQGIIEYVNKASEIMFGRSTENLLGKSFGYPAMSGNTTEIELLHRGRPPCVAEMRVVEVEWKGRSSFLATLRDISERIQLSNELDQSYKELEKFTSLVSHEIRAPLRNLHLLSGWLLEDHADDLNSDAIEDVQLMRRTTERMQRMVEDLVNYSRCGLKQRITADVELEEVLVDALDSLHEDIIRTDAQIATGPLPTVDCDVQQMVTVFQHIISNAIAYCSEKPQIMINASCDETMWRISFTDNGIGVKEKFWDKIFTPFNHLHSKDTYEGTGIGLATCKKIVEQHRGRIWLESNFGVGSVVHVCLPEKQP